MTEPGAASHTGRREPPGWVASRPAGNCSLVQYSHSRLVSYENCPQQFRYRYLEKIPSELEGIEAFLGKRVHEILERLYHHVGRHGRPPSLAQVHDRFRKDWLLHWHPGVSIVREEADVDYYQGLGQRCLEHYYRAHYPFDEGEGETLGIEQPVELSLDPAGRYQIRGVIDRVVRRDEGHYEIHDYKTGGFLPGRKRIDGDRQLGLYQIGLEKTYGDAREIDLVWHYLAFNKSLTARRTEEQLEELREDTIGLIERIEHDPRFPATPGPLCRWCEYRGICTEGGLETRSGGPLGPEPPPLADLARPPLHAPKEAPLYRPPVQLSLL